MSGAGAEPLTAAESKVLKIVWRLEACAARDVYEEAAQRYGWAPTTTKTLLRRLVDKGHLVATRVGNSFLYKPARAAVRSSLLGAADALLDQLVEGTTGLVLSHLVRKSRLTAEELAALRAELDRHEATNDEEAER